MLWQISERRWASRWDAYLRMPGGKVHWCAARGPGAAGVGAPSSHAPCPATHMHTRVACTHPTPPPPRPAPYPPPPRFSILNSLLIVLVMASLVATILIRTVRRDLAKYEQLMVDGSVDMKDESGWKLLTGDVFRAPQGAKSLCVYVGTGVQVRGCARRGGGKRAAGAAGAQRVGGRIPWLCHGRSARPVWAGSARPRAPPTAAACAPRRSCVSRR